MMGAAGVLYATGCSGPPEDASGASTSTSSTSTSTTTPPVTPIERVPASTLDALAAIGQGYLIDHPQEANVDVLLGLLGLDPGPAGPDRDWVVSQLGSSTVITDEFGVGETVEVDGWLLAFTEARLCAVAFLTS
jgi:hypothetical protein